MTKVQQVGVTLQITSISVTPKTPPRRTFNLPLPKLGKSAQAGRMSQATVEARSSSERVLDNTPSLANLYEFLKRPMP